MMRAETRSPRLVAGTMPGACMDSTSPVLEKSHPESCGKATPLAVFLGRIISRKGADNTSRVRGLMMKAALMSRGLGHYPRRSWTRDDESGAVTSCVGCGEIIAVDLSEKPYIFGRGVQYSCTYRRAESCTCPTCKAIREATA